MKRLLITGLLAVGFSFNAFARGGEGVGNGGGAWVCHNQDRHQTIRWARLVDLYEAETEFSLSLEVFGNKSYQEIIDAQRMRLFFIDKNLYEKLDSYFEGVDDKINEVSADLEIIDDALYRVKPSARDCLGGKIEYAQLANYTHYGTILINKYLFNHPRLSEVDKAALFFHEVIYAYLRDRYKDNTSVRAREMVGYIFSNLEKSKIAEKLKEILSAKNSKDFEMQFVTILNGSFTMGSPSTELGRYVNEKQRDVWIFYNYEMMTTEVTQAMYFEVTGANPSSFKEQKHCPLTFETRVSPLTGKVETLCPHHPVDKVSFIAAQSFIELLNVRTKMNYRLPTEAEWEWAVRAGSKSAYFFGDNADLINEYAIHSGNSGNQTHPVGPMRNFANKPNRKGLYDMYGNVSEWTQDWYTKLPSGGFDPTGPTKGNYRVYRGGNWQSSLNYLRSAYRYYDVPFGRRGFRLVRTLPY